MTSGSWKNVISGDELKKACKYHKGYERTFTVEPQLVDDYIKRGYKSIGPVGKKVKISYKKKRSEMFEDSVWMLVNKLGFTEMNSGSDFGIPHTDNPDISPKQIDVFGSDGSVSLVIECKCAECDDDDDPKDLSSFKSDLEEIGHHKEYQTRYIRDKYNNPSMDVGFVFFTRKYNITENHRKIAKLNGVSLLNEYDLAYYNDLYRNLGSYAKYQFLCDVFKEQPLKSMSCKVPAVKGFMGDIPVFTFLIRPSKLLPLAYVAHRRQNDPDIDRSYQRMVKKSRLEGIRKFIKSGGFFSNNIIVNIDSSSEPQFEIHDSSSSPCCGLLSLPDHYKSMWVIDGQHRLFSFIGMDDEAENMLIPVTAFYNLDKTTQSRIFVEINSKQKKVDPNLLLSIESDSKMKSDREGDWADALNLLTFVNMSSDESNPLFEKVSNPDDKQSKGDISASSLYKVMGKTGLISAATKSFTPGPLFSEKGDDHRDSTASKATRFFTLCFDIFRKYCSNEWNKKKSDGGYLTTSNGMTALIMTINEVLRFAYPNTAEAIKRSPEALYKPIEKYLKSLAIEFDNMSDDEISTYRNRQGAAGQTTCHKEMLVLINKNYSGFTNLKIETYIKESDLKYTNNVSLNLPLVEQEIVENVKIILQNSIKEPWSKTSNLYSIGKELNDIRYDSGNQDDSLEDFIDIIKAYEIIIAGGSQYFGKVFGIKSDKSKSFADRTSWIKTFKVLREKIDSSEKIMKDESEEFDRVSKLLHKNIQNMVGYLDLDNE